MKAFTTILIVFLVVGLVMSSMGFVMYLFYVQEPKNQPMGPSGFIFETYPDNNETMADFHYVLNIEPRSRAFTVEVYFVSDEQGEYRVAIFTPYQILNLEELIPEIEASNVEWTFYNSASGSIIVATFEIDNNNRVNHQSISRFEVSESVTYQNYGVYTLDLPLGTYYAYDIQQLKQSLSLQVSSGLNPYGQVKISLPKDAVIIQESHNIQSRTFSTDNKTLEILLDNQENVFLQYSIPSDVNGAQNTSFLSGIFIGIGVPLFISTLIELFRRKEF